MPEQNNPSASHLLGSSLCTRAPFLGSLRANFILHSALCILHLFSAHIFEHVRDATDLQHLIYRLTALLRKIGLECEQKVLALVVSVRV